MNLISDKNLYMPCKTGSACVNNKKVNDTGPFHSLRNKNYFGNTSCNCGDTVIRIAKNVAQNSELVRIENASSAATNCIYNYRQCESPKTRRRTLQELKEKIKRLGLNSQQQQRQVSTSLEYPKLENSAATNCGYNNESRRRAVQELKEKIKRLGLSTPFVPQQQQQMSTSWEYKKLEKPAILDTKTDDDEKDEQQYVAPPRFIKISDGKISLGPPKLCDNNKEKEMMERRIFELETALLRLQDQLNATKSESPKLEKDLKDQLENMNRTMKSKERKAMQACREHKVLQARFTRQETILQTLQQENKNLHQRIRQYEHCLDDVMRKVVDAIVAEDSLREEVSMLKGRVRDLEAQNIVLSSASPVKGKDEGYCTMSSDQPQPSSNHLEDLPEEPEQWLLPAEPCPTEMEDWSMSQEEFDGIKLDEEHDWIWQSSGYLNSTMIDSQSEGISKLLGDPIIYSSDDEEITCIDFTRDFYKLVSIPITGSTRSLHSHMDTKVNEADFSDDDDNNISENGTMLRSNTPKPPSPTPSEAGEAFVTSCSSSESEGLTSQSQPSQQQCDIEEPESNINSLLRNTIQPSVSDLSHSTEVNDIWRKSNGWKRLSKPPCKKEESPNKQVFPIRKSKIPPPVPVRRSYIS